MKFETIVESELAVQAFALSQKQLPYAQAILLTRLGLDAKESLKDHMSEAFDRPTDFTLRGIYTQAATKSKLESVVYVPDSLDDSGKAKREYIRPGTQGSSQRRQKRTEYLLTRMGALPPGWVTTPGKGAQLDGNGNLAGSVYKQIINVLQIRGDAKPVSQRSTKAAARLKVPALFFVIPPGPNKMAKGGGWLPPGVWKNLPGGKITQILKSVRTASYKPRVNLQQVANQTVKEKLPLRWEEASALIFERFTRAR